MTSMLECCLSGAIIERKRDYPCWLLDAACVAALSAVDRPHRTLGSKASPLFGHQTGVLSLFVEFKYLLEFC